MTRALIGYTGFVGGNILAQQSFDGLYNRTNIEQMKGQAFKLVVCAGAPAAKWIANKEPTKDLENIRRLTNSLAQVQAERFVLISTIDVYPKPVAVDEDTPIPGSMETCSYVLVGLPGASETFGSSTHGAGRVMSRHEALRTFRGEDLQKKMEAAGMAVKAPTMQSLAEEAGAAYKDVNAVVESVQAAGVTRMVARLTPLGVIKG